MFSLVQNKPHSAGIELDCDEKSFGFLEPTTSSTDFDELRKRLTVHGYLYLPRFLDPDAVFKARQDITSRLALMDLLHPDYPAIEGIAKPGTSTVFMAELAFKNPVIENLIYGPRVHQFFSTLLKGQVRHYDFTWFRPVGPGKGTPPHCDLVFMGRGTKAVFTMWVPYGEIPLELGGLMILEGSHLQSVRLRNYLRRDVDEYCSNRANADQKKKAEDRLWSGWLAKDPVSLQRKLGGRWLTASFKPGDALIFGMSLVHASLDNQTDRVRFSSDCRYQRVSEPIDNRWIGDKPLWHSSAAKRGRIC